MTRSTKRFPTPRESARRKSENKLSKLGYTPLAAKTLSEVLLVLAESSHYHCRDVLQVFTEAAKQKTPWPIIGKRF